jgi:hypothetical protein
MSFKHLNIEDKLFAILMIIILALIGLIILIMPFVIIDIATQETMRTEIIECYDRYSNEIIGEKCSEEIKCGVISKWLEPGRCYISSK